MIPISLRRRWEGPSPSSHSPEIAAWLSGGSRTSERWGPSPGRPSPAKPAVRSQPPPHSSPSQPSQRFVSTKQQQPRLALSCQFPTGLGPTQSDQQASLLRASAGRAGEGWWVAGARKVREFVQRRVESLICSLDQGGKALLPLPFTPGSLFSSTGASLAKTYAHPWIH